ncbi:hypothetical protein [Tabrizicola sp.]|uniref:hypothetical protein n=1 Tax=Tabrizicola sp. TaxID=2005166 RepID=UPI003F2AC6A2
MILRRALVLAVALSPLAANAQTTGDASMQQSTDQTQLQQPTNESAGQPYGENTLEQKAVLASEEVLKAAVDKLNESCGTAVTAAITWTGYDAIKALPDDQKDGRTMDNIYSLAGGQVESHLLGVADACQDELFKSNLAKKLKSIVLIPRVGGVSAEEPSHVFDLKDGVLTVTYHAFTNNTATDTLPKLF